MAHYYFVLDYFKYFSDKHLLKFLKNAFDVFLDSYDYDGLLCITFPGVNVKEGITFSAFSKPQQYLLQEIVKRTNFSKDSVYSSGSLCFIGISSCSDARDRLIDLVNGSPVKYEEYYKKLYDL